MPSASIRIEPVEGGAGDVCRSILDELPSWFGIAEANDDYVAHADRCDGVIALVDDRPIGITTVLHHSEHSAEIYLMAVRPTHHRAGVGSAMLDHVERRLVADGVEYLQVKTLSPAHRDPGYAATRRFYVATGFRWLEEFPTLWGEQNPALMLVKRL